MKSTVIDIQPDTKDYIRMVSGALLILIGILVMWDLLIQFIRLVLGFIIVAVGLFLFYYRRSRYAFRFFGF